MRRLQFTIHIQDREHSMLALQSSSFQCPASRPTIAVLRPPLFLRSPKPSPIHSISVACRFHCHSSDPPVDGYALAGRSTLGSLTVTAVFLALGFRFASGALVRPPPVALAADLLDSSSSLPDKTWTGDSGDLNLHVHVSKVDDNEGREEERENVSVEDRKLEDAFEQWKSKSYALTVPLTVVSLRGSVPPSWIKDFLASQGKRVRLQFKLNDSLEGIFSNLSSALSKGNVKSTSPAAADVVSIGDSWLPYAIKNGLVEPIDGAEEKEWFTQLSDKWKTYLRRNSRGVVAQDGKIWAAPYRWGCMVIAYKKSKFEKLGLDPIEDWKDLWRPELGGRIAMVDCPREVIGIVLKYMGFSYNTVSMDNNVSDGTGAIQKNLALLAKQVRLFDSKYYLKAFGVDDVWVAVGWSSDIIPAAKRLRNIAVIVPKSGTSLWADLWAIPSTSKLKDSHQIGGRVRGASPLIHQWMEFCTQPARALPFHQGVIPGAIPSALNGPPLKENAVSTKGQPKLETNLVSGVPPPEILSRCEFLEPLSDVQTAEYNQLIRTMQRPGSGFIEQWQNRFLPLLQTARMKLQAKPT